jgi:hypothetical protein
MSTPGVEALYWWVGQVVDKVNWEKETTGKLHKATDTKGENYSYRVRIIGRHDPEKTVPDKDLPIASVLLPVTAGSGHAGSVQTPNIKQGTFVVGYYKDGVDGNEPLIAHVLPNNAKTTLFQGDPQVGYTQRSGFSGANSSPSVSTQDIDTTQKKKETVDVNVATTAQKDQFIDGTRFFYIPKTKKCEGPAGSLKGIQKSIGDVISILNLARSGVLGSASDLQGLISNVLTQVQNLIASLMKTIIDSIRSFIVNKINEQLNIILAELEPRLRIIVNQEFEGLIDILLCIFQKIIKNLLSLVKSALDQVVDRYVNAPLCAAEAFISNILSNVFNEISNGINNLIAPLGISQIAGTIFSGLSIVIGILEFLTCEEELSCEMDEQWSIFSGARQFTENINAGLDKRIEGLTTSLLKGEAPVACNTSQVPCGPPQITFIGQGSGAVGNPIISATGAILGVDLISGGTYKTPPTIQISDVCGRGSGAYAVPIMKLKIKTSDETEDEFEVESVVIIDPGTGYLPYPDGSTGGNGYTFSGPNDTIVFNNAGYNVYQCGTTINVLQGDLIYLRTFASVQVYDSNGSIVQELIGRGQTIPITIEQNGTLTTPECVSQDRLIGTDPASNNSYPVVLELEDVVLTNPGVGYSDGDTISITPGNGAELDVIFDDGEIKDIIIVNRGIGFTEYPKITINSQTGFNAVILPLFRSIRVGDLDEADDTIPIGASVINVVDCVGKV